jgi:mono/diheme cytochrome c family protein
MQLIRMLFCACWFSSVFLQVSICCFEAGASPADHPNATASEARAPTEVRSITLPHFEPQVPIAPGRDDYLVVCVSCHSPRYVIMQPLFPQRQWEETVDKMAKVYGAQMDQDQRASIVRYLVSTHGPDSRQAPARDEDSDFASAPKLIARSETSPLLKLAEEDTEVGKELEHGAALFAQNCAPCHGTAGRGDGFVGQVLLRKPKSLAATRFSLRLLSQVLWNGKPGTAMPSWRGLPQQDLTALAAYVQSLHQPDKGSAVSLQALQRGNQVFQQNCAACHGVLGDGKGAAATTLIPEPANFKLKQPDLSYIMQVLSDGIAGTAMPAWKNQIAESDRQALAGFLRSLFEPRGSNKH